MRTGDGWTALHCAACWGNYEIVGILLANKVDVNSRTEISDIIVFKINSSIFTAK
jgi:ankyrin repeat protein